MQDLIHAILQSDEKSDLRQLISNLNASGKHYFLHNEILQVFAEYCQQAGKQAYFYHSSALGQLLQYTHELILEEESAYLLLRPRIASQSAWRLTGDLTDLQPITMEALLDVRDRQVNRYQPGIFEIDLHPFYQDIPVVQDARNIGQGFAFLNRYLCHEMVSDRQYWLEMLFDVLHRHEHDGIPLLINDRLASGTALAEQVKTAIKLLGDRPAAEPYEKFRFELQELGFEPGWGNTVSRVKETLELLDRLIAMPEPALLEAFVTRIPAVFRVVLVSMHGWVAQESVLGRAETDSDVTYALDQARQLAHQLTDDLQRSGLDTLGIHPAVVVLTRLIPNCEGTACDLRSEKIHGTENGWILRVPFREFNPKVTQNWMSKFEMWPYLEGFAADAERELLAQLGKAPDLIIGNYSDGNLVAFLLARRLKVTHCTIAHSLEKSKYLFGDLYWQELEDRYHFSAQFTADLISMNAADFIITSSYQEIVGTPDTIGQYESYKCFTMPQLYHVVDGVELFSPKFNRIPPGVNRRIFFPSQPPQPPEQDKPLSLRDSNETDRLTELLFTREDPQIWGYLADPAKRPLFAVSQLEASKNLSGLIECYGISPELQERCNLILVTNKLRPEEATNLEEVQEIEKLYQLIEQYSLQGKVRWIGMRLPLRDIGEAYRVIADRQGIFVHLARFEAFGQSILEAMICGLPTFATQFGGSTEIIDDGDNGFLINPTDLLGTAKQIVNFIERCELEDQYWQTISDRAIQKITHNYSWESHIQQLLLLSKIYSFWNFIYHDRREALLRYLETLFHLVYKPRAEQILEQHMQRL